MKNPIPDSLPADSTISSPFSRRAFIRSAGAAAGAVAVLPGRAWGQARPSAANRITIGVVGWGMMGPANTKEFLAKADCQVVAACDLNKKTLQTAVDTINTHYGNTDCKAYHDYRELLARDDIDAVMLAVPDHWHALVATAAANRKKDIYGEKPLAKTVAEQQAIVRAVEKNHVMWQTGSWQRSLPPFHKAAEIVRNGLIGRVVHVEVGLPGGHHDFAKTEPALLAKLATLPGTKIEDPALVVPGTAAWDLAVTAPPPELDYDTWIGPSKMEPYIEARVNKNWRWNYDTGGGQLMDWIGHHGDIAHWGLGFDGTGPSEVEGHGEFPAADAMWNTATVYRIECKYRKEVTGYEGDVSMTIAGGHPAIAMGTKWIGTDGWVWVNRGGFDASNEDWIKPDSLPEELRKVKLYESANHWQNFLDSVKSRKPTIAPVQTAHHSTIPGHLGLISMLVGRKIKWDVANEKIVGDSEASALLSRPYRAPYRLA
ncbi:MAG TPA: Gfo/Idh/MocA family oxidoreductase [Terracidiphilus sp.]|nr:Gfo/Idh/MocA family oxidoreductase [Terracidiphilus sp.]